MDVSDYFFSRTSISIKSFFKFKFLSMVTSGSYVILIADLRDSDRYPLW